MRYISWIMLLSLFPLFGFGQTALINALNSQLIPIKTLSSPGDFSDLKKLDTVLTDIPVIGLGEATHGTKEFFVYKQRLIEYLIVIHGFKTLVIEADFVGTQAMNDYVLYGKGSVFSALEKMGNGVLFTAEFIEMIEWLKKYNSTKSVEDKIKVYGCDMQFSFNAGTQLSNGHIKLQHPLSQQAKKGLEIITAYSYGKIDKADVPILKSTSEELRSVVLAESNPSKVKLYQQYLQTMIQTIDYALEPYLYRKDVIRDQYMAENCEWIYNYESKNKMIVWAHNLHISKNITKNNNLPMGYYLKQKFLNNYYALGFGFNSGKLRAFDMKLNKVLVYEIPEVKIKNSSDYIFSRLAVPNFILDFESASKNPVIARFLNDKMNSRQIGGAYYPERQAEGGGGADQKLMQMFDGIVFFKNTTNATGALNTAH